MSLNLPFWWVLLSNQNEICWWLPYKLESQFFVCSRIKKKSNLGRLWRIWKVCFICLAFPWTHTVWYVPFWISKMAWSACSPFLDLKKYWKHLKKRKLELSLLSPHACGQHFPTLATPTGDTNPYGKWCSQTIPVFPAAWPSDQQTSALPPSLLQLEKGLGHIFGLTDK